MVALVYVLALALVCHLTSVAVSCLFGGHNGGPAVWCLPQEQEIQGSLPAFLCQFIPVKGGTLVPLSVHTCERWHSSSSVTSYL